MEAIDLCVPIYLNQRIVFDHLAIIEDGFSEFKTVTTSTSSCEGSSGGAGASVGVANIFGLLGVQLGGHYSREGTTADTGETATDKTHTPTSLFSKLRSYAASSKLLKRIERQEDLVTLNSGDIVEFEAVLRKNPLIDALETMLSLLDMSLALAPEDKQGQQKSRNGSSKEQQKMSKTFRDLLTRLQTGEQIELVANVIRADPVKAVLSAKMDYFIDRNASEIIDGEFRVFGKVVRSIATDESPPIDLLRKTPLGAVGEELMKNLVEAFKVPETDFRLPAVVTAITAPACQVLPIAIFT